MRNRGDGVRFGLRNGWKLLLGMGLASGGLFAGGVEGIGLGGTAYAGDTAQDVFGKLSSGIKVEQESSYTNPDQPTVYLTFDDGPSRLTGQVLDILKREHVEATFFVLGNQAEGNQELVKRIVREGHAVGNHSYNHVYEELYKDFKGFWKQAAKTDKIIEDLTGEKPFLLRAPGGTAGNFDAFYFYYLEQAGYTVMDWNVDSQDAVRKGVKAEEILETVRKSPLKHELVVLMHDGTGHEESVKALPGVIAYYREQGYRFARLTEDVKPVQFRLGSAGKWARSYSHEGFRTLLADVEAAGAERRSQLADHRSGHAGEGQAPEEQPKAAVLQRGTGEMAVPAAVPTAASKQLGGFSVVPVPPLTIQLARSDIWTLTEKQYGFDHERLAVPLRQLVERLGGTISWDSGKRTATVALGTAVLEYDPYRGRIREQRAGQLPVTRYLADVALVNGEIRVPLRATVNLLGGAVTSYALDSRENRVELALPGETGLLAWTEPVRERIRKLGFS